MVQTRGHLQARGSDSWRAKVYIGRSSYGRKRYVERTIRGTRREAETELGRLVVDYLAMGEWESAERELDNYAAGHAAGTGTFNGSLQVPGNGQPIVLMRDRGTSGGYPKIATVISADFGRFAQIPAGRGFRFRAVSMAEAQAEARRFAELLRTLPERLRAIESVDLNIDALHDANVAGHAVSAVDAGTWHGVTQADVAGPD